MTPSALEGLLVLDLSVGVSGAFATKLLADLGADVVMVESPDGSPLREHSLFEHLCGGKRSTVVNDEADVAAWFDATDVVVTDGSSPWHSTATANRRDATVVVDVSPFGRSAPYASWRSSDLVTWAMGGYLYFTGSPDREPIWVPGCQAQLHAGAHAAIAALVALHERDRSGRGQRVEVSELEAVLTAHAWLVSSWAACGLTLARQPCDLIRASDGWVYVMRIVPKDDLFVLIDRPDLAAENLTVDIPTWHANIPRIFEAVALWAKERTVAEIVELGQLLRLAVTPVLDGPGVLADEQLAAREWWEREGLIAYPGQPYRLSLTPSSRRGPAPSLGQHSEDRPGIDNAAAFSTRETGNVSAADGNDGPLKGLRIIEVTTNWAGPVAGRFLADLGADDIKVEWATRPATWAARGCWRAPPPGCTCGSAARRATCRPGPWWTVRPASRPAPGAAC